jgi:hypothetical protein
LAVGDGVGVYLELWHATVIEIHGVLWLLWLVLVVSLSHWLVQNITAWWSWVESWIASIIAIILLVEVNHRLDRDV